MTEKQMVNDALNSINMVLVSYASIISQTEHKELRETIVQFRNVTEQSQYDLYQLAKKLGYYVPSKKASYDEIQSVRSEVCACKSSVSYHVPDHSYYLSSQSNGILDHMDTHLSP